MFAQVLSYWHFMQHLLYQFICRELLYVYPILAEVFQKYHFLTISFININPSKTNTDQIKTDQQKFEYSLHTSLTLKIVTISYI